MATPTLKPQTPGMIVGDNTGIMTEEERQARLANYAVHDKGWRWDSRNAATDAANAIWYGGSPDAYRGYVERDQGKETGYGQRASNDYGNQGSARGQQANLADYFAMQAMGQGGPSVAQKQLQAGLDQSTNAAMGIAASSRGNPAAAARAAIQAQGQQAAQTNQQAAMLRAQEQLDAGQLANQAVQGMRQQDLGAYNQNMQGEVGYRNVLQGLEGAQMQEKAGLYGNIYGTTVSGITGTAIAQSNQRAQMFGAAMQGIGTSLGAISSDKRLKKNIHDGDALAQAFMDSLDAKGFQYKGDNKPQLGIMAQDMERTREGRSAVIDAPGGKAVSVPDATSRLLAAVANLNKRTKELEGKRGGR